MKTSIIVEVEVCGLSLYLVIDNVNQIATTKHTYPNSGPLMAVSPPSYGEGGAALSSIEFGYVCRTALGNPSSSAVF